MRVNPAMLHLGADDSNRASHHAGEGADALSAAAPTAGMFGDFEAADAFNETIVAAHAAHVGALQTHRDTLHELGTRTHQAAYAFTAMEDHNAKVLRDV